MNQLIWIVVIWEYVTKSINYNSIEQEEGLINSVFVLMHMMLGNSRLVAFRMRFHMLMNCFMPKMDDIR